MNKKEREEGGREEDFRGECKMRTLRGIGNVKEEETRRTTGGLFIFRLAKVK